MMVQPGALVCCD